MAVSDITLRWSGESATASKELDFESPGNTGFVEVYEAVIDPTTDDSFDVLTASGIPKLGDQKGSNNAWVTNVVPARVSPILVQVVVTYSSFAIDPSDPTGNPFNARAKVNWVPVKVEGEIDEDADGEPIVTTAGEPVLGIKRTFSDIVAVITQPFPSFNPFTFYDFIDRVNEDEFLGFPPGTGKVESIRADEQALEGSTTQIFYYNITAEVAFRNPIRTTTEKAWYNRRVEKGKYVKNTNDELVPAMIAGEVSPSPVYLDANGRQTTEANAIWSEDKIYGTAVFENMGFNFG